MKSSCVHVFMFMFSCWVMKTWTWKHENMNFSIFYIDQMNLLFMLVSELSWFILYLLPKKSTSNLKIGDLNLAQLSLLYIGNHCEYITQQNYVGWSPLRGHSQSYAIGWGLGGSSELKYKWLGWNYYELSVSIFCVWLTKCLDNSSALVTG